MYIAGYAAAQAVSPDAGQKAYISGPALGDLRPGDTLEAKVVSENGDILTLKTPGGLRFTARGEGTRISVGQTLELSVKSSSPDGATVEISAVRELDPAALARSFGAEPTSANIRLVREMAAQKMPLTEQNFMSARQLISAHKALASEQAVFMLNNKIPVNPQTIGQFQGFLRQQNHLGAKLAELAAVLDSGRPHTPEIKTLNRPSVPAGSPMEGEAAAGTSGQEYSEQPERAIEPPPTSAGVASSVEKAQNLRTSPQNTEEFGPDAHRQFESHVPEDNIETPETARITSEGKPEAVLRDGPEQAPQPDRGVSASAQTRTDPQTDGAPLFTKQAAPSGGLFSSKPDAHISAFQASAPPQDSQPGTPPAQEPMVQEPSAPLPREGGERPDAPSHVHARDLPDAHSKPESSPAEELREMARALFKKVEAGRGSLLSKELDAPSLKRELIRFLSALEERSELLPNGVRHTAARAAREIGQSFSFMEQINNFTAYVQLPLNINGAETTAELYVFNDNREKKNIDPQNATMFFSLGTANIGRVEVFAKVIGKDVQCDFGLEAQDGAALFRGHMEALAALLDAGGYRLSRASAGVRERSSDVLEISRKRPELASRYTLDRSV